VDNLASQPTPQFSHILSQQSTAYMIIYCNKNSLFSNDFFRRSQDYEFRSAVTTFSVDIVVFMQNTTLFSYLSCEIFNLQKIM
tara:strand:- start:506 stop:754 length:249 start_codon:yes stop_codon:yes gene_type:complete